MVAGFVDDRRKIVATPLFAAEKTLQESTEVNPIEFPFFGLRAKACGSNVHGSPVPDLRLGGAEGISHPNM